MSGYVDVDVLVDLGGVDFDVDLLGVLRVVARLPVTRSSKRMPKASSRSASWMAWLTQDSPCMPIMPRESGCAAGKAPRPSSVEATGICAIRRRRGLLFSRRIAMMP